MYVVSCLHMDSNFPYSIFNLSPTGVVFSQLHWAKVCLWAGLAGGSCLLIPRQNSLSSDKTAEKEVLTAQRWEESTLQRNTRHSVFVRKRDKAVICVSRWKVGLFSCALKISSASLIYWTTTWFIHSIIYSLNYLNEWLFMI